jgi:site-specific DNA-methyltransferase (adenine-specific)
MAGKKRKSGSKTSSFGAGSRASHDASYFYSSRMYQHLPGIDDTSPYIENPLPPEALDAVIAGDSRNMSLLPDQSVHLMVTSPPYNARKIYDQDLTLDEYLEMLRGVFRETWRVLVLGGRACINVANLGRKAEIRMASFVNQIMIEEGFLMRGEIIWDKGSSAGTSTAWGSWQSASNPTIRDVHEYILVFSKGRFKRERPGRENTISRDEFLEYTKSVWRFPTVSARRVGHPAPFPVELPKRLIQLYTFTDEIVLDPFMGSGSTALAALETGRHFVGYDLSPEYVELARQRITDHQQKKELF